MSDTQAQAETQPQTYDLKRAIEEISSQAQNSKTPIFIAILAAFLALVSMADDEAGKQALQAQIEASNQFAYFQAKNIRRTSSEIAADTFTSMGQTNLASSWKEKAKRYNQEKVEILNKAKSAQKQRSTALKQGDYYGIAVALLQIAIVLASVSLITGGGILIVTSVLLSLCSAIMVMNGYGLYFDIPTDPTLMIKGLGNFF